MPPRSRPRLIITENRPGARWRAVLLVLVWIATVAVAAWSGARWASPDAGALRDGLDALQEEHAKSLQRIDRLIQKQTTLERSAQVERDAARALQDTLAERDAELASLRNDVAFFERLAGNTAQRQPLAVHSLSLEPLGDGGWRYLLILTQNLKKAAISKGSFTLQVEGSQGGALRTLEWTDLVQKPDAAALPFSFKYFQQIEGSIALPPDFIPHRVRVNVRSNQGQTEQVVPWPDASSSGVS
ncbi:MAG: hypothetical protein RBT79_03050 [Chiayiivirga sp.]|jgi:hypothetical protein|uniref:DUF6776 family protein n=1 Tax=Denitratimonas tolerans TaxID=1338420 RepID=A0AAW9R5X3_9GAMM|nr:hypothetical protein [Xanthomonadaceae bacterium]MDX9763934.1 hypothetical protein [Chiayiivirga sp.]HMN35988.1 hypothetical protein [Chiayiivirga sp.]